jgi:hypothetical protein
VTAETSGDVYVVSVIARALSNARFGCFAAGCDRKSFTQHTDEIGARRRTTARCRELMGRAQKDRSTASVAREYGVSWSTAWTGVPRPGSGHTPSHSTGEPTLKVSDRETVAEY